MPVEILLTNYRAIRLTQYQPEIATDQAVAASAATISGTPSCPDAASRVSAIVSTKRCLHAGNFAACESRAAHHSYRR
jgi:hypothetical protein